MTCSRSTRNSSRKRCSRSERPIFRLLPCPVNSDYMRLALRLARRGYGTTSPNPMVGAVLVKGGRIIGRGWHRRAGGPHAEIEALRNAQMRGHKVKGATLYVTLEPCCTHGRTPPCTDAIVAAGIRRVVAGAVDPNPRHRGRAFDILRRAGITVTQGVMAAECARLNEAFNHWIVQRTAVGHGQGGNDARRQDRHCCGRIEMDYRRKGAGLWNEVAARSGCDPGWD